MTQKWCHWEQLLADRGRKTTGEREKDTHLLCSTQALNHHQTVNQLLQERMWSETTQQLPLAVIIHVNVEPRVPTFSVPNRDWGHSRVESACFSHKQKTSFACFCWLLLPPVKVGAVHQGHPVVSRSIVRRRTCYYTCSLIPRWRSTLLPPWTPNGHTGQMDGLCNAVKDIRRETRTGNIHITCKTLHSEKLSFVV